MKQDDEKTLEEKTQCRLFSQRVIDAVAEHKYLETAIDDDEANAVSHTVVELLRNHDPAIVAEALRDGVDWILQDEPKLLARLLADLGLVLDCTLLDIEMREQAKTRKVSPKA